MVNKQDIIEGLERVGIKKDDTIIVHSSLKSFGVVNGGAETVIEALKEVVKNGTLCFPSLTQKGFRDAYKDWDKDKTPSDVGLISEVFRKQEGVKRSNQATHSATAYGVNAEYITAGHDREDTGRCGIYGTTPFSKSSPWQKIFELDGKVVLLGVSMVYNTFKHFLEYSVANDILDYLDCEEKMKAKSELSSWQDILRVERAEDGKPLGVWFWNDGEKEQELMDRLGLLNKTKIGESEIIVFKVKDFYNTFYKEFINCPENWFTESAIKWIKKYRKI